MRSPPAAIMLAAVIVTNIVEGKLMVVGSQERLLGDELKDSV